MRAITREAGVAPGALYYHFESKEALVAAVLQTRSKSVALRTSELLTDLIRADSPSSARQLVSAILQPFLEILADDPKRGLRWIKFFVRLGLDQDPIWLAELGDDPSLTDLFLKVAADALPDIDNAQVQQRCSIAMFTMLSVLMSIDAPIYAGVLGPAGVDPQFVDQLVAFTSSGLVGPSQ